MEYFCNITLVHDEWAIWQLFHIIYFIVDKAFWFKRISRSDFGVQSISSAWKLRKLRLNLLKGNQQIEKWTNSNGDYPYGQLWRYFRWIGHRLLFFRSWNKRIRPRTRTTCITMHKSFWKILEKKVTKCGNLPKNLFYIVWVCRNSYNLITTLSVYRSNVESIWSTKWSYYYLLEIKHF